MKSGSLMLKKRIIARLDIKAPHVILPYQMEGLRVAGDPVTLARLYNMQGIDELLYVDTVASLYGRNSLLDLVKQTSEEAFCPIAVAGGVRTVGDAIALLNAGADKIGINTAACERPEFITELAQKVGSQSVMLQVDAKKMGNDWVAWVEGGREPTGRKVSAWIQEAVGLGAGEILLTSIDRQGTCKGFDMELLESVKTTVPVILSGGCRSTTDISGAFLRGADAVAVASAFHEEFKANTKVTDLAEWKRQLKQQNVEIR
jgi:cyclase